MGEHREAKAELWLQRLQETAGLKESLVDYCRRHGLLRSVPVDEETA